MVAIEPILEDIKRKFKTKDVRLPKTAEAESFSASFAQMKMSAGPGESLLEAAPDRNRVYEFDGDLGKYRKAQASSAMIIATELPSDSRPGYCKAPSDINATELPSYSRPGICELPSGHANSGSSTLVQRQDTGLDEKSSMLDDAPQTSRVQPSLPQHESRYDNFDNDIRTIGPEALSSRYTPLYRPIPDTERDPYEKISESHRSQGYLPYRIWHHLETLILRGEYRRRKERRRLCGITLPFILIFSLYTFEYDFDYPPTARRCFRGICGFSIHYMLFTVDILLNILYLVICFPLIWWVAYRHR